MALLAIDQQQSIVCTHQVSQSYSPFGGTDELQGLLGYAGQRREALTSNYLLGNGYRAYNPQLQRFNSPDSWSPFGRGGINAYAYCENDPVNRVDPSGHSGLTGWWRMVRKTLMPKLEKAMSPVQPKTPDSMAYLSALELERQGWIKQTESIQLGRNDSHLAGPMYQKIYELSQRGERLPVLLNEPSKLLSHMIKLFPAKLGNFVKDYPKARSAIKNYSAGQATTYLRHAYVYSKALDVDTFQGMLPEHLAAVDEVLRSADRATGVDGALQHFANSLRQSD